MKRVALARDKTGFWTVYQSILESRGLDVRPVDIWKAGAWLEIRDAGSDAFVWRAKHSPRIKQLARRLLYLADGELHMPTFPDWRHFWHYDDKIAQTYLMREAAVPIPDTRVFFDREEALDFCGRQARFPLVAKCAHGAGSANVKLLKSRREAERYVKKAFGKGLKTYFRDEIQKNYVYLQRFIPGNDGDYRVVCLGSDRISGFFRRNRKDVALASGSGMFDTGPLPEDLLDFICNVHHRLGYSIMSYDILRDPDAGWVVTEMSVIYGDLTHTVYDDAVSYRRIPSGGWRMEKPSPNRHEMLLDTVLRNWGWI